MKVIPVVVLLIGLAGCTSSSHTNTNTNNNLFHGINHDARNVISNSEESTKVKQCASQSC
ncbi:hypothetical protein TUM17377_09520 [Shewanella chilikensis]|nr:hypothetical protein TUM17377_09520 [Shewanella chilikensis]